jgi:hypothetical protein
MLISLSKKFVFVANLKTASTAIEKVLRPYAELALVESRFGKHQPFRQIEGRYAALLRMIDPAELFVFGVMRDPVDYMISLYNSHMHPKFRDDPGLYTAELGFDRFLDDWTQRNVDQVRPQRDRFTDRQGRIACDYIISYHRLAEGLRFVGARIGVAGLAVLPRENESHGSFQRSSLTAEHIAWIESRFAADRNMLNSCCDRLLTPRASAQSASVGVADAGHERGTAAAKRDPDTVPASASFGSTTSADAWIEEAVQALYRVLLLREADPKGLESRIRQLRDGRPIEEVMRQILRSPEFARIHRRFLDTYTAPPGSIGGTTNETVISEATGTPLAVPAGAG